tara:strand:- start:323 stop:502 length:180 start_codon:yes stop_codon:yes gene_type:complete
MFTNSDKPISKMNKKEAIIKENIPTITVELTASFLDIQETLFISTFTLLKYSFILPLYI